MGIVSEHREFPRISDHVMRNDLPGMFFLVNNITRVWLRQFASGGDKYSQEMNEQLGIFGTRQSVSVIPERIKVDGGEFNTEHERTTFRRGTVWEVLEMSIDYQHSRKKQKVTTKISRRKDFIRIEINVPTLYLEYKEVVFL